MVDEKLKACPFCGGKAGLYEDFTGMWLVQCDSCGVRTLFVRSPKKAIANWERRKSDATERK